MPATTPARSAVPSMGCGYVVCALLVLAGAALIAGIQAKHGRQRQPEQWIGLGFGAALCFGGLALIAPMQREVARAKDRQRREEAKPDEPWTWDPAWTNPRGIVQASRRNAGALMVWSILALAISLPPAIALFPSELAKGNQAAWALLIFPAVSGSLLATAAFEAWRRRKYGAAHFVPAALPLPLGGTVTGMVTVDRPVRATGTGRVALDCWCTTISQVNNRTRRSEEAISHTEREIATDDWKMTGVETQLFVQLPVRGGQTTTMTRPGRDTPHYEWRLRVAVPTAGADFVAEFTLPVFAVGGQEAGVVPDAPPERTRRERAEIWRAAGIVEEANGLVLPRGLGRSVIFVPLMMALVPAVIAAWVWWAGGPTFITVIMGLFGALCATVVPSLWNGGGERVWVEGNAVCVQPAKGPQRTLAAQEVQELEVRKSAGVGTQQFYRIVARLPAPGERRMGKRFRIASMVLGDEAAHEVVAWLEERLTRP